MASRRIAIIAGSSLLVIAAVGAVIYAIARQGDGDQQLAQAPLNIETQIPPSFIMAVDDSGSMSFHLSLPASDGQACWARNNAGSPWGFFDGPALRTGPVGSCSYSYAYTGPRIGSAYTGIPPLDSNGFARSPDFNPAYFDPSVTYEPWLNGDGTAYGSTATNPLGNASLTATRMDPRNPSFTINLAANLSDANDRSRFQTATGMFFPGNTTYRLVDNPNCGGLTGGGGWQTTPATGVNITAACPVYVSYWPATFYLRTSTVTASDGIAVPGYGAITPVPVNNACGAGCTLFRYTIRPTDTVALQNFANWYSFYGNRNRAMVAGMTLSLADINNMRVGYFTINSPATNVIMQDMGVPADRAALYTSMLALPASGGTPNLTAVNRLGRQFQRTDAGAPVRLSCQKNAGMLFTDGFSNASATAPAITGLGAPFDPTPANSLAAIASQYYFDTAGGRSPLRADAAMLDGMVPVPAECATLPVTSLARRRLDCQRNLHMNFYGITLGGQGRIFNQAIPQDPFVLNPAWPGYQSGDPSTVDDIWHATVNTRGEFISARTPSDITNAMRRVLASVGAGKTPSGSIALTGSRVGNNSLSVVPFYEATNNSTDWYSTLTAQTVKSDVLTGAITYAKSWEATEQMPVHGRRNIHLGITTNGVVPAVVNFDDRNVLLADLCSNSMARCTPATIAALGVSPSQAIAYLRGDQTQETASTGILRRRTKVLGDIVNSSPVVSVPTDDYGYRSLRGATAGTYNPYAYDTYLVKKKTRTPTVFVGANDGMLHAFNGKTGVEEFAYIPATALGHMGNLLTPYSAAAAADQRFQHRYYVDGPVSVSDAYTGKEWKTVLVGTSGAGGRGVFGLDVSTPAEFGKGGVLWELNDQVSNVGIKNNIGHVLGKPLIVPVKVGDAVAWKALFGNGYGSINGRAALFVVDLLTGDTTTLLADEGDATLPAKNGLGNLIVLDRFLGSTAIKGSDGFADTVYGGDQNGALWKFNLRAPQVGVQAKPFFIAKEANGDRQSITGGLAAASGAGGGVMLYFGTGSFAFRADGTDSQMQTLYGVQDRETSGYALAGRGDLQRQKVLTDSLGNRTITTDLLTAGTRGWYLDLGVTGAAVGATAIGQGERSVGNPAVESGMVFFPTYQPTVTSGCGTNGLNRIYGLNALSGGGALSQVKIGSPTATPAAGGTGALALETGGSAPIRDVAVLSTARVQPLQSAPTAGTPSPGDADGDGVLDDLNNNGIPDISEGRGSMVVQVAGAPPMYLPRPCGRQSWRQLR